MSSLLSSRLGGAKTPAAPSPAAAPAAPAASSLPTTTPATPTLRAVPAPTPAPVHGGVSDAMLAMVDRATKLLHERTGTRLGDTSLSEEQLHTIVVQELGNIIENENEFPNLSPADRRHLTAEAINSVIGYGPLQPLIDDETVSEIMVNGPDRIYIERDGQLTLTGARFTSEDALRELITRIARKSGRRIDDSSPLLDTRLPDGSRASAGLAPVSVDGSVLTIRRFPRNPYRIDDLIRFGTLTPQLARFLEAAVKGRVNIMVVGGTGSGKTTLLNALTSYIPSGERIFLIEDASEIQAQQDHVVRMEARPANTEGKGAIEIRDLVRFSLRQRPDRIVVGEVRGGEALDMLQAMNTGHDGSLSTVHANSSRDAVSRLETLVLMSGVDLPQRAVSQQIAQAIDLFVVLERLADGTRRVTEVSEVQGMEGDTITLQRLYEFDYAAGRDPRTGRFLGKVTPKGIPPKFRERLEEHGTPMPAELFQPTERRAA